MERPHSLGNVTTLEADGDIEYAFHELWPLIESSNCVVWIGSGLSYGLYPSWGETIKRLCKDCGVSLQIDDDALLTDDDALLTKGADFYMALAEDCKVADRDKYNASLQSMFGKLATNERRALSLLIRLPAKGFVTTNYDRLLREQANLYNSTAFAPRAYPYLSASDLGGPKKPIYHIHGAIAQHGPVNIVLSKSEYKEAYGSRYSGPLCQDSEADVKTQNADPSPSLKSSPVVASGCVPAYTSAGVR